MELQDYIKNAVIASRQKTLANSDQLTLGEMILKIESIISTYHKEDINVVYDFGHLFPTDVDSWRGSYNELALDYKSDGKILNVKEFHKLLTDSVGKEFDGYKGGEYEMSTNTPVWVANYGCSGNTAVIDVVYGGYQVIIMTGYREF